MTVSVEQVLQAAQRLSPAEQLELIRAISQSLLRQYQRDSSDAIPSHIKRTAPVTDLAQLAADFWPDDESADDINDYIAQQRQAGLDARCMTAVLLDTNIVAYLFKRDSRAMLYAPHLLAREPAIALMTVAELFQWAAVRNWGEACVGYPPKPSYASDDRRVHLEIATPPVRRAGAASAPGKHTLGAA